VPAHRGTLAKFALQGRASLLRRGPLDLDEFFRLLLDDGLYLGEVASGPVEVDPALRDGPLSRYKPHPSTGLEGRQNEEFGW